MIQVNQNFAFSFTVNFYFTCERFQINLNFSRLFILSFLKSCSWSHSVHNAAQFIVTTVQRLRWKMKLTKSMLNNANFNEILNLSKIEYIIRIVLHYFWSKKKSGQCRQANSAVQCSAGRVNIFNAVMFCKSNFERNWLHIFAFFVSE